MLLVRIGRIEDGWGAGGAVGWRSWEIRKTSGMRFAQRGTAALPAWGVGLGGCAVVTASRDAMTRACYLCTAQIKRIRNSKPAMDDFTVAVNGELAGEGKYLQVVKAVGSGVLRWRWDCLQRSLGWPRCACWISLF